MAISIAYLYLPMNTSRSIYSSISGILSIYFSALRFSPRDINNSTIAEYGIIYVFLFF